MCDQPSVVKDENVSLDRCPSEDERGRIVEAEIDEPPDHAASGCRWSDTAVSNEVEIPGNIGELEDESDDKKENDRVIVQSFAGCLIGEEMDEHEERANDGGQIEDEKKPESKRSWPGDFRIVIGDCATAIVHS